MTPKTIDVLSKGLEYIEEYGWIKGNYGQKNTGFCAAGAIREADEDLGGDGYSSGRYAAEKYMEQCVPNKVEKNITLYNDSSGTVKSDIIELFKCAIEKAKAASDRARHAALSKKEKINA